MKSLAAPLIALAANGCVVVDAPTPPETGVERPEEGACNAGTAQAYVGKPATQETGAAIHRATGARSFQWVGPGMAVTMDFREDRVRVSYDRDMAITAIRCG